MTFTGFDTDDEVFVDETVLTERGGPDSLFQVKERDGQLQEFTEALRTLQKGLSIQNILVSGQPGVGKTLITKLMADYLRAECDDPDGEVQADDLRIVYLNCSGKDSSYKVARDLVNKFRDPGNKIPPTGHSADFIYDELFSQVEESDHSHVLFILDEIDAIGQDDDLMYRLARLHDQPNPYVDPDQTETGYIGIMNDLTWKNQLGSKIQDSLTTKEIKFPAYKADELRTILNDRVEQAFADGVVDDDVVPLIAAITARSSGSARVALDMLYEAGSCARSNGDDRVTEAHVREAEDEVLTSQIISDLRSQPLHGQIVMHALLVAHKQGNTPIPQSDLYAVYRSVSANQWDSDPQAKRSMDRRIRDLLSLGFVETQHVNEGATEGSHDEVMIGEVDPEKCREAIREELEATENDPSVSFEQPAPSRTQQRRLDS